MKTPLALVALLSVVAVASARAEIIEQILVKVNGEVFTKSDLEARSDGSQPILVAGEEAGGTLPFGCRMGICHTCVGKLCSGKVRDLRTGEVSGSPGEVIRTCINAPEGDVEIAL